ncbi:MAG: hypothetical protein KAI81_09370, partial [Candidatus Marinimicrobia bacterium]|nr:hypothetical protein [Candidatus Neomarinimicrobiota bacterium]
MKFYLIILIILLFIWPLSAQPYRLFIIEGISSKMNGDYREKERRIKDFTNNGNFYRSYFQEEINMTFSGTFYHPNLMTYNSSLGVNLNQGKFASENSTLSDNPFQNSFFGDMSISTLILPKKPANLRINYNKNNRRINRSIYENIDQKFHNITLSSQFRIPFFPLTVSGGKSNSEDDLLLDRRIIREEENFRIGSRFEDLYKFDGNVDLIIKNQLREDNNGQHRQSRNLYRFNLKFPDKKTISAFNTGVNILYSQNKSNISSNNINLTQHNAYKFSDDLNINCKYSYQNNQYEKSENNLVAHNMSLNIRHNFYSSLVSEASLKASQNNSNEQKSNNIKIPLQWNY